MHGWEGNGGPTTLDVARAQFFKKVKSKKAGAKGYTEIKMAAVKKDNASGGKIDQDKAKFEKAKKSQNKSKLDENVQSLINFIFDKELMTKSVVAVGYDVNKMPLGELSKSTVMHGYRVLRQIEDVLGKKTTGDLAKLSGEFYTHIPHNFGFQKMSNFIINTVDMLKQKLDLIQTLVDIQVAHNIVELSSKKDEDDEAELDKNFKQLKCKIKHIKEKTETFEMINKYVQNTSEYYKLNIVDCFELEREGEAKIFNPNKLENRKLLWHGSRFSNFVGILSQGMRIAPPEAPRSGYLFGKGVYFADLVGKSTPYCRPALSNNIATFVLCEVALGKTRELTSPDCNADNNLPKGCSSTHALGRTRPNPS